MDAPNSNKLKSGLLVALYALSLFAVAATPTAMAQEAPDVKVNFVDDQVAGDWYDPGVGALDYNTTRDVFFTNISTTAYDSFTTLAFFAPDQVDTNFDPTVPPEQAACGESTTYQDPEHSGKVAASFYNCHLGITGTWVATAYNDTDARVAPVTFLVNVTAANDLNVKLDPSSITYDLNQHTVTVTVTDEDTGNPVEKAKVTFLGSTKQTGSNGKVVFGKSFANVGVGTYKVTASKNTAGAADSPPERFGNATFEVKPAVLDLDEAVENPIQGFTSLIEYEISFPHNETNVFNFTGSSWQSFTVKLSKGGNPVAWANASRAVVGGVPVLVAGPDSGIEQFFGVDHVVSDATTAKDFPSGVFNITRVNPDAGNLTFWNQWTQGTWLVGVGLDQAGDADHEYVFDRTFTPSEPGDISVTVEPDIVDVPARGADAGPFTLQIFGEHEEQHPITLGADNITVTGDYVGDPVFGAYNATGQGKITISNITPTRGDGEISFVVNTEMDNEELTGEATVQIDTGAVIPKVEPQRVTVETPTDVHVWVEDVYGNAIPDAKVTLYWPTNGTTIATINGGGAPGEGKAGEYIFDNVNLTDTGTVFAYAEVGQTDQRFAYSAFEAVPAHDLQANAEPDTILAGRATTLYVNVTQEGKGTFKKSANLYVLNENQWQQFEEKGASALPSPAVTDADGNFTLQNFVRAPGVYHIYVRGADGLHDIGMENVPEVTVNPAQVEYDPDVLVKGVDKNQTVKVTVRGLEGNLLNGTLAITSKNITVDPGYTAAAFDSATSTGTGGTVSANVLADSIPVTNGVATVKNVTAKDVGKAWFYFEPTADNSDFAVVSQQLEVRTPQIKISPEKICVGETNRVTVSVLHPATNEPIGNVQVRLVGQGINATATTGPQGQATVSVFPTQTGVVNVRVAGDVAGNFTPTACLSIEFLQTKVTVGEKVTMVVSPRGAAGTVEGAQVFVDGQLVGETGLDGRITLGPFEEAGTKTVKVTAEGFANETAKFTVEAAPEPPADCKPVELKVTNVNIQGEAPFKVDKSYIVSGTVELVKPTDERCEPVTVQVKFQQGGVTTQIQQIRLAPGESEDVGFTWTPSQTGKVTVGINGVTREVTVKEVAPDDRVPGFTGLAAFAALGAALVLLKQRRRFD